MVTPEKTPNIENGAGVTFQIGSDSQTDIRTDTQSCAVNIDSFYPEWQPLQPQISHHLSRSCHEIIKATSVNTTRSASAGDIPSLSGGEKQAKEKAEVVADVASKRRHRSEVHRPLMWQASVDHLTPIGQRRKRSEVVGRDRARGQPQTQTHLKVRTMIKNFRRSFSDLFSIEEHT